MKKYKKYWENGNRHEKTVIPFMTNGGWPGHVIRDIKASCPHADFACDMQVKFDFSFLIMIFFALCNQENNGKNNRHKFRSYNGDPYSLKSQHHW